ncbi:hypothetical protein [Brevundimonas sp.]|uniref:hypothetical protein n=1 Tax=Brevundimonas sp. TaxID=1871086 RepID=UPI002CF1F0AE|nr:hypothetical protein [Brevundimonas sp.]HWQ87476.1 hypothetical protein [Brevundimonas sp.]
MRRLLGIAGLLAASLFASAANAQCREADAVMLAMSLHDFDQTEAGWRSLDAEGCQRQAAEAIGRYRTVNAQALGEEADTLIWHEGQMRAFAGDTEEAIRLMLIGRDRDSDATQPYTDATIAFLRRDRPALLAARERLVALPVPEAFARAAARYAASYPDHPALTWPLNLNIVDGLIACFDRPYREAYACEAPADGTGS